MLKTVSVATIFTCAVDAASRASSAFDVDVRDSA